MTEAYKRLARGEKPSFSHDLNDEITAGFGKLDWSGEWEYPLVVDQESYQIIPFEKSGAAHVA